jgi:hypothetical protein
MWGISNKLYIQLIRYSIKFESYNRRQEKLSVENNRDKKLMTLSLYFYRICLITQKQLKRHLYWVLKNWIFVHLKD